MINSDLAFQAWRTHERVFRFSQLHTDEKEAHVTEFIMDQAAGVANQAIAKAMEATKKARNQRPEKKKQLNKDNQQLIKRIHQYIEVFTELKGHEPYWITLSREQHDSLQANYAEINKEMPSQFQGISYMIQIGAV